MKQEAPIVHIFHSLILFLGVYGKSTNENVKTTSHRFCDSSTPEGEPLKGAEWSEARGKTDTVPGGNSTGWSSYTEDDGYTKQL